MKIGPQNFIEHNDPVKLLEPFLKLYSSFNKPTSKYKMFNLAKQLYINKVKYPLFKRKVRKMDNDIAEYLIDHPDSLLRILSRYITFFILYCHTFNIQFVDVLDRLFDKDELAFSIDTEDEKDGIRIKGYSIVVRSLIPQASNLFQDVDGDLFAITRLEADLDHSSFDLSQNIYQASKLEDIITSRQFICKVFSLKEDGKLYNPMYAFGKELLERDKQFYRLMIAHIMGCITEIFDNLLKIQFIKITTSIEEKE